MKLETDFLLSQITTFQLGGPAKWYLKVSSPEEAVSAVLMANDKKIKYCLVGGGSNMVFADKGFSGLVIHWCLAEKSKSHFGPPAGRAGLTRRETSKKSSEVEVVVSAGVKLADLIKMTNKNGLAGLEKLAGIPGTVGGAVVGNAGAYGQAISDRLAWVEIFDGDKVRRLKKKDCSFDYRNSIFKRHDFLILRVGFKFKKMPSTILSLQQKSRDLIGESKKIIKMRWSKFGEHPICAGSFFKNVVINDSPSLNALAKQGKISTARLIEEAGLTDLKQGGISIAPWHHNFLINDGTGTTSDLQKLVKKIKKVVHQKLGIELEEEVRLML